MAITEYLQNILGYADILNVDSSKADPGLQSPDSFEVTNNVRINDRQYFGNVPLSAWGLTIGGYQPAQKWLKDRRGRTLSMEEIQHYQKIIVALVETERVVGEVDWVFEVN